VSHAVGDATLLRVPYFDIALDAAVAGLAAKQVRSVDWSESVWATKAHHRGSGTRGQRRADRGGPDEARAVLEELQRHRVRNDMPPEVQKLGRALGSWFDKICNYHLAGVTNGPTEALNNLVKRIKRIGFGFRDFENHRISALLYAGSPNWRVMGSIVVR
jgi:hypothetical protein